jgi:hypothetical protein
MRLQGVDMKILIVTVLTLGLALPAAAQTALNSGQLNFQYREAIPPNGDLSAPRAAILTDAEKDCDAAQKAFGLTCVIGNIQFNNPGMGFNYGNQPAPNTVSANVNMMLMPQKPN